MSATSFAQLPFTRPGPYLNAWGVFGDDDELGRLNLITPEAVKRGRDAIKHGLVVNVNLPLSLSSYHPAREGLVHTINFRGFVNDDHLAFNTQTSTQWDGFRHYPYQDYPSRGEYRFYNNQTMDDAKDASVPRNGIQNFVKKPITSRGILLDIPRYIVKYDLPSLDYFSRRTPITLEMLQGCAQDQEVEFEPGDILLLRTGYTEALDALPTEEKIALAQRPERIACGVAANEDTLRWHWENGIAAVVGDNPAYECFPALPGAMRMHEVFLAGWGMPIGELFDLRELATMCAARSQWSFLFASMPLYVVGGIASPPSAQVLL